MIKRRLASTSDEESLDSEYICVKAAKKQRRPQSILSKVLNRSSTGNFNCSFTCKSDQKHFKLEECSKICLKDIIPFRYLNDHIFMGLTSCGNFLISYRRMTCESESSLNYDFNTGYKYELFFWLYRPHMPLSKYVRK